MASALPLRRVAVVDEEEIFRRGVVACLSDDPLFVVVLAQPHGPLPETVDVAVASSRALAEERFHCPVVLCRDDFGGELPPANAYIRRLQHQMATRYNLISRSRGKEPNRRVKIFRSGE